MPSMGDTGEKIIMKDHDILISVHTLQTEMIRRMDGYIESNNQRILQTEREMSELSKHQVKIDGEVVSLKGMLNNIDERVDRVEVKSVRMDLIAYTGAIIAGLIALLKP